MIKNRFLFFRTKEAFEAQKANISSDSIVFIQSPAIIWTHDTYYVADSDSQHIFLTQEEYDNMEEHDESAVYFIYDEEEDEEEVSE